MFKDELSVFQNITIYKYYVAFLWFIKVSELIHILFYENTSLLKSKCNHKLIKVHYIMFYSEYTRICLFAFELRLILNLNVSKHVIKKIIILSKNMISSNSSMKMSRP